MPFYFNLSKIALTVIAIASLSFIEMKQALAETYTLADTDSSEYGTTRNESGRGLAGGWTFTVTDPLTTITSLATLSYNSGGNEVITLWNFDEDEILAQVTGVSNTNDWRYYGIESVSLHEDTTYAITVSGEATNGYAATNVNTQIGEDYFPTTGPIVYNSSLFGFGSHLAVDSLNGLFDFGTVDQHVPIVDFGYNIENEDTSLPTTTTVPTPAAASFGSIMLSFLMLRRNKQRST
ncbi:hypothetical protein JD969_19915 [Planctomycetota bacterium]|nr:hypothetical protein JD969_19915 [Planctomycetota bacterium]